MHGAKLHGLTAFRFLQPIKLSLLARFDTRKEKDEWSDQVCNGSRDKVPKINKVLMESFHGIAELVDLCERLGESLIALFRISLSYLSQIKFRRGGPGLPTFVIFQFSFSSWVEPAMIAATSWPSLRTVSLRRCDARRGRAIAGFGGRTVGTVLKEELVARA